MLSDKQLLRVLALSATLITLLLVYAAASIAQFDSSARLVSNSLLVQSLLRWDVFYFLRIAEKSYTYENEWAFLRALPSLMKSMSRIPELLGISHTDSSASIVLCGTLATIAVSSQTACVLYDLTLSHFGSRNYAMTTAVLSLLPSSPATFYLAPNNEPFFTYLAYQGMLCCTESHWFNAAIWFTLAANFRSNGVLLSGFIIWGQIVWPFLTTKTIRPSAVFTSLLYTTSIFMPFAAHNTRAYKAFCLDEQQQPWCNFTPPMIYSYVQSEYWNVGFLRYWTVEQIPNFVIAIPPLLAIFSFSTLNLYHTFLPRLRVFLFGNSRSNINQKDEPKQSTRASPFLNHTITPHAILAIIFGSTLIFAAHTQIVLRLAASMPITYWAAAWLLVDHPSIGRWWVGWSIIWGAVSALLWGAFLPPA